MPSRIKRAHRTHALMQPAGEGYPHLDPAQVAGGQADRRVLALFAALCECVPDPAVRAKTLGVSTEVEAAWSRGAALPLLRAHRRSIERVLRAGPASTE